MKSNERAEKACMRGPALSMAVAVINLAASIIRLVGH
jgi:hypothetical protein